MFPGLIAGAMFLLNLFKWWSHSTSALPFGTMVALAALWFGITLPLVMVGSYFGFKKQVIESPVRTNQIPRQVPEQVWYLRPFAR
jgi:transmembrane 9 superfamily protein 2/4